MWKCRSSYGDKCCSLHDSHITEAAFENKILYLRFEDGIMLLPATWANPFKDKVYRSDPALVAIPVEARHVSIPQDAVEVLIRGSSYLFGKEIGRYEKEISVDALVADIAEHSDKYEIVDVYASESGHEILMRGVIHNQWRSAPYFKDDTDFEITVLLKTGAKMRFFWNELDMEKPV